MNNYEGKTIGKLFVIERYFPSTKDNRVYWNCRCECGKEAIKRSDYFYNLYRTKSAASCGCERLRLLSAANSKRALRPYEALYNLLTTHADKRGKTVELSYTDFLQFTNTIDCEYCGASILWQKYGARGKNQGYNLDRKDNSGGYTVSNCAVCCARCNISKGERFTYEEWKQIGNLIRSW